MKTTRNRIHFRSHQAPKPLLPKLVCHNPAPTMPKLHKIFRIQKADKSLPGPYKRTSGIFRRRAAGASSKIATPHDDEEKQLEIHPAITFSLSDDEASDRLSSPMSDIENQVKDPTGKSVVNEWLSPSVQDLREVPSIDGSVGINESTTSRCVAASKPATQTREISVGTEERNNTMTFTHLEIMRSELSHMMQLATKDKEIKQLTFANEEMMLDHAEELALKDLKIKEIQNALAVVEGALSQKEEELVHANAEQTRIIEILMKTQYDLYEQKHQSWIAPVLDYFSLN